MFYTPQEFGLIAQGMGCFVLVSALVTGVAFTQGWTWRFRAVGVTAFSVVLTVGLFALSLAPITPTTIVGAVKYKVVYDRNASEAVISVSNQITPTQLEATLRQASANLFSLGRNGGSKNNLIIRARTVIHPQPEATQPLYLGQIERSLRLRDDPQQKVTIYPEAFITLASWVRPDDA
jgi:hypothetical protein